MFKSVVSILLALASVTAACAAPRDVGYLIRPELKDGALVALAVELRFAGDAGGRTRLAMPDQHDVHPGRPDLADLVVSGATASPIDPTHELLRHRPGAQIVVRYRIVSGFAALPDEQPFRALLLPGWFAADGDRLFVTPQERDAARATVRWAGLPNGWIAASDLDGATVGDIADRYVIGGGGWREIDEPLGGATLRLYVRPELAPMNLESGAAQLARIARAGFAFWGDSPWDLFVPIVPLASDTGGRAGRRLRPHLCPRTRAQLDLAPDRRTAGDSVRSRGLAQRGLHRAHRFAGAAGERRLDARRLRHRPQCRAAALRNLAGARRPQRADPGGAFHRSARHRPTAL